jgi:hypothetical protein
MSKIKKIMNKFDNEYERMVDHLRIMGEQMVLLNPKINLNNNIIA